MHLLPYIQISFCTQFQVHQDSRSLHPQRGSLPWRNVTETGDPDLYGVLCNQWGVFESITNSLSQTGRLKPVISKTVSPPDSVILVSGWSPRFFQLTSFSHLLFSSLGFLITIDLALASAANTKENGKLPKSLWTSSDFWIYNLLPNSFQVSINEIFVLMNTLLLDC